MSIINNNKNNIQKNKKSTNKAKGKILVILGPTASGKTVLGVRLANKYSGEIVSADSRQVYQGMDIGTAKDLQEYQINQKKIPYHLIDIISPKKEFNLANYQSLAFIAIADILQRDKLPIIVGGSGLYLQALVDNYYLSSIKPNFKQRKARENLGKTELFNLLFSLKPDFANKLNNSDKNNPRRLIRYLEILEGEDKPNKTIESSYEFLILGLDPADDILRERIVKRIKYRLEKEDMIGEVERLHEEGVSWQRLISFGLEYKFISYYLLEKLSYEEMFEKLSNASYRFAKRQKTWFKRWQKQGRDIIWLEDDEEAELALNLFLD
ncbi:MAG: tRNA (adenosine(37)-N6)-dimethylallyltransferase MiaA [Clostridia bacterium]|nr:tRNA (adenosine(37)-N6)-dimethylallyltransferase MiaA [Clostridia bacterium]